MYIHNLHSGQIIICFASSQHFLLVRPHAFSGSEDGKILSRLHETLISGHLLQVPTGLWQLS
ncbi:Uncharacterized protein dnl_51610 [Desulfonema limicola]|uniref:Uncharacterized protein n=1 Tax=Desulfonema limicola TaxID=45656 RepID=A0A975BC92_9BACT|nr:Uncharacterized protein dnl_51610 [Desulfonema limicola]